VRSRDNVTQAEVSAHYQRVLQLNVSDPSRDLAAAAKLDLFWLSFTLSDMGIPPILGPRSAKWFYVVNHRKARWAMAYEGEQIAKKVIGDVRARYGIVLDLDSMHECDEVTEPLCDGTDWQPHALVIDKLI